MAPVPEDNQDDPSRGDKDNDILCQANPISMVPIDITDSSDEEDSEVDTAYSGYSLLPQDPNENDADSDSNDEERVHSYDPQTHTAELDSTTYQPDEVPGVVLSSEAGAVGPMFDATQSSFHPEFLAKFPDGKIPSYMQVPDVPNDKGNILWNQNRQESAQSTLDSVHENQILRAMSGFRLPSENIPDWAKALPEDQWQTQVLHRIKKSERADQRIWTDSGVQNKAGDKWTANFKDNNQ